MRLLCVSVHQPWASLIAHGVKTTKVAPYSTRHRGPVGVHACKTLGRATFLALRDEDVLAGMREAGIPFDRYAATGFPPWTPFGAVVGLAELVDCVPLDRAAPEDLANQHRYGDYAPGSHLWLFTNARPIDPVPARGNIVPFWAEVPGPPGWGTTSGAAGGTSGRGR